MWTFPPLSSPLGWLSIHCFQMCVLALTKAAKWRWTLTSNLDRLTDLHLHRFDEGMMKTSFLSSNGISKTRIGQILCNCMMKAGMSHTLQFYDEGKNVWPFVSNSHKVYDCPQVLLCQFLVLLERVAGVYLESVIVECFLQFHRSATTWR
jgi:hypothetical protein